MNKNGLNIYKSKGEFRWRIYRQGRIIAASSEGYKRLRSIRANLCSIAANMASKVDNAISEYRK